MNLDLPSAHPALKAATQVARVRTEAWAGRYLYCPNCPADALERLPANRPVADLECPSCEAEYELKAGRRPFGARLVNGAYDMLVARLAADAAPHLLLMQYDPAPGRVVSLQAVPRRFLSPQIAERRRPLAPTARRAGWVGSTLRLDLVPRSGRIELVRDGQVMDPDQVRSAWRRTAFLEEVGVEPRGWLADVLACVEEIADDTFTLADVYAYEDRLQTLHPENRNVRPKIRQQLQRLRDHGLVAFEGGGRYRRL